MALPQILRDLLVCPKCKGELQFHEEKQEIHCPACKLIFAIVEDVPNMLIDEAKPLP